VAARSRATGDGPKAIFADGLAWLRERKVLLPGVTTLARLVAGVRDESTRQMWEELARLPDPAQRRALDRLPEVPHGARVSDLERWRRGPAPRGSGQSVAKYLDQVAEISGLGLGTLGIEALLPPRRLADLDRRVPGRRPRHERRLPADRQEGRPGAGAVPAVARLPELRPARDPGRRERPAGRPPGRPPLAQAWGGGLVAAVDGMRFVVPVPAAFARPNRKFFGSKRGMTWLNAINDRGMGRGAKIVSGTVRDSLHMVDVIFGLDGGEVPEIVVSDTASYSHVVFGLLELLGISYRPALADLPDQKGWRIKGDADYGPLNTFARGKIDLAKIRRNWEDILRVVASIYTGAVRATTS
jgi:Tn3 transposase DDE domain-containing protein